MRRAAKTDANHAAIRDHLRAIGWSVSDTSGASGPRGGFPDMCVSRLGRTALVEVKSAREGEGHKYLTQQQRDFINGWQGAVIVTTSPQDAEKQLAAWLLSTVNFKQ